MPSTSPKQAAAMRAAAHSPEVAKKMGVPQGVAQEFNRADQLARAHALRAHRRRLPPPAPDADMDGQ